MGHEQNVPLCPLLSNVIFKHTDSSGDAVFSGLLPRDYRVAGGEITYNSMDVDVTLGEGQDIQVNLYFFYRYRNIYGTVLDNSTSEPIENAWPMSPIPG